MEIFTGYEKLSGRRVFKTSLVMICAEKFCTRKKAGAIFFMERSAIIIEKNF